MYCELINKIKEVESFYKKIGLTFETNVLSNLEVKRDENNSYTNTLAINTKEYILYFNNTYVSSINENELYFAILHEIQHIVFNSADRIKKWIEEIKNKTKDKNYVDYQLLANICEDALINGMLRYNYVSYGIDGQIFSTNFNDKYIFPSNLQKFSDYKTKNEFQKEFEKILKKDSYVTLDSDLLYTVIDTPDLMEVMIKYLPEETIIKIQNSNKSKINSVKIEKNTQNENNNQKNAKKAQINLDNEYKGKESAKNKSQRKRKCEQPINSDSDKIKEKSEIDIKDKTINLVGNEKNYERKHICKKISKEPHLFNILKKYLFDYIINNDRSYSKYNRKNSIYSVVFRSNLTLPGYTKSKMHSLKNSILFVDVSGSISREQKDTIINNIHNILKQFRNNNYYLHVVSWAYGLIRFDTYNKSTKLKDINLVGYGGTNADDIFSSNVIQKLNALQGNHKILKNNTLFDYCFILTDGYIGKVTKNNKIYKNIVWILPKDTVTDSFIESSQFEEMTKFSNSIIELLENY